ncbi:MAG: class I SAM-dependent methyltransferase [Bacteroidetes bacterium]|nr:class I SAM-dependent methyltransferase [Bacteroidota bacterium]
MESLSTCPVCGQSDFRQFLNVTDHFLSMEQFVVVQCVDCGFRFTNPRPEKPDIGKYYESTEYIAHNARKRDLLSYIYRGIRSISVRTKYRLIKKYSHGRELIDIGCGTGELPAYCAKNGYKVTGIEPNEAARHYATEFHGIEVYPESYLDAPGKKQFDVITMWHVLEHVHDLGTRMERIRELMKPEGTLIVALPNNDSWDSVKYREFWAALDVPRHLYHFTQATVKLLGEKHGFHLVKIVPLKFDAFYISLISEKYKTKKQNYFRAFLNGIKSNKSARRNKGNYSSLIYLFKIANEAK